jgi:hypothetical protein
MMNSKPFARRLTSVRSMCRHSRTFGKAPLFANLIVCPFRWGQFRSSMEIALARINEPMISKRGVAARLAIMSPRSQTRVIGSIAKTTRGSSSRLHVEFASWRNVSRGPARKSGIVRGTGWSRHGGTIKAIPEKVKPPRFFIRSLCPLLPSARNRRCTIN